MGAATTGTVAWVFPDLIVTNLLPGQVATVVRPCALLTRHIRWDNALILCSF